MDTSGESSSTIIGIASGCALAAKVACAVKNYVSEPPESKAIDKGMEIKNIEDNLRNPKNTLDDHIKILTDAQKLQKPAHKQLQDEAKKNNNSNSDNLLFDTLCNLVGSK